MFGKVVFFDTETTSRHVADAWIIQLAAMVTVALEPTGDTFEVKLRFPVAKAEPEALAMNCYDVDVWDREAVSQQEGLDRFLTFLAEHDRPLRSRKGRAYRQAHLAGHNVLSYDFRLLQGLFRMKRGPGAFAPYTYHPYDTLQLAHFWRAIRQPDIPGLTLSDLGAHFGLPTADAHDALADVQLTIDIARRLCADLGFCRLG